MYIIPIKITLKKTKLENNLLELENSWNYGYMEKIPLFHLGHLRSGRISRYIVNADFLFSVGDKNKLAQPCIENFLHNVNDRVFRLDSH